MDRISPESAVDVYQKSQRFLAARVDISNSYFDNETRMTLRAQSAAMQNKVRGAASFAGYSDARFSRQALQCTLESDILSGGRQGNEARVKVFYQDGNF
ncbi:MAG TPA: hypothetical protein P5081_10140 [Phycisphaerae bacterium]|nr:hypothetical protein [Phycisphaerae bacterium]HRW53238.1 hypothetical protein [Phycisphaerae bacterium]